MAEAASVNFLKPPAPRKLTDRETLSDLNQWWMTFRGYYRRCQYVGGFFDPEARFHPEAANHGFEAEAGGLKRSAAAKKDDLAGFYSLIGSYMPFDYVSQKLMNEATNIDKVKEIVFEIYDVELNAASFLDFAQMSKGPTETYRNYWNRLVGFMEQHLPKGAVTAEGVRCEADGEKLSISLLDSITIHWLLSIDRRLIGIVKTEFATELKTKRLCQLVKTIATNVDDLLKRYDTAKDSVNSVTATGPSAVRPGSVHSIAHTEADGGHGNAADDEGDKLEEAVDMIYRLAGSFREGRGRQFTSRGQFRGRSGRQQNTRRGCRHCDMFNKKIGANLDIKHRSDTCPNQHSAQSFIKTLSERVEITPVDKPGHHQEQNSSENVSVKVQTVQSLNINKIGLRNTDWSSILKSKSPRIKCDLQGVICGALIDSGAEVNVVDKKFTLKTGIRFVQTEERAEAANRLPLDIVGWSELLVNLGVQVKDGKTELHLDIVLDKQGKKKKVKVS